MNNHLRRAGGFILAVALSVISPVHADTPKPSPSPSPAAARTGGLPNYDSFRLVHTRNVFDPDRRPVHPSGAAAPAPPPTRADYAALTGIAVDGDKTLAFFSGSRPEYNLVIPVNNKIAGATLTAINAMNVEVDRNGRHLTINVGQTVPLDDKSTPAAAPADAPASTPSGSPAAATAPGASPAAGSKPPGSPPAGVNLEEIRRRMMERHSQDLK